MVYNFKHEILEQDILHQVDHDQPARQDHAGFYPANGHQPDDHLLCA